MTNLEIKARKVIKEYDLDKPDRHRPKGYRRIALARILRNNNFTTVRIGELLNRSHCTVVNMLQQYEKLKSYNDFLEYEAGVAKGLGLTTVQEVEDQILLCENYWELRRLQELIKKQRGIL